MMLIGDKPQSYPSYRDIACWGKLLIGLNGLKETRSATKRET